MCLPQPMRRASKKRQGTKSREVGHRLSSERYGDLILTPAVMVGAMLALAGVVRIHEHRQHLAPEQTRQHVDMHEEVGARGGPSRAVEREPSTRHDHMHVRMMAPTPTIP